MQDFIEVCLIISGVFSSMICLTAIVMSISYLVHNAEISELRMSCLTVLATGYIGFVSLYPATNIFNYGRQEQRAIEIGEITYSSSGNLIMSDNVRYIIYGTKKN